MTSWNVRGKPPSTDEEAGARVPDSRYHAVRFAYDPRRNMIWQEIVRRLQTIVPFGDAVLDVGCGYGEFINNVSAASRTAVDSSAAMKSFLQTDVMFAATDALSIDQLFPDKSFSFVFCSNLVEHLERDDIGRLFEIFSRLVRPGGYVGILMPNYRLAPHSYFDDYTHRTPVSDIALSDWLTSVGLHPVFADPAFMPLSLKGSRLPISRLLIRAWFRSPFRPWGGQMLVVARRLLAPEDDHVAK